MMKIKRKHPFTGELNEREISITPQQLSSWYNGISIQNAMPNISADDREYILTGLLPGEYDELMSEE